MSDDTRRFQSHAGRFLGGILMSSDARGDARPSIGEIGLNQFAPYREQVASRWNANLADAEKSWHDDAEMRACVLSITSGLTISELSVFAVIGSPP